MSLSSARPAWRAKAPRNDVGRDGYVTGLSVRSSPDLAPAIASASIASRARRGSGPRYAENDEGPGPLTRAFSVELRGIEPLTSSMPWKRSTN